MPIVLIVVVVKMKIVDLKCRIAVHATVVMVIVDRIGAEDGATLAPDHTAAA
jgi:hypothetical protein